MLKFQAFVTTAALAINLLLPTLAHAKDDSGVSVGNRSAVVLEYDEDGHKSRDCKSGDLCGDEGPPDCKNGPCGVDWYYPDDICERNPWQCDDDDVPKPRAEREGERW